MIISIHNPPHYFTDLVHKHFARKASAILARHDKLLNSPEGTFTQAFMVSLKDIQQRLQSALLSLLQPAQ